MVFKEFSSDIIDLKKNFNTLNVATKEQIVDLNNLSKAFNIDKQDGAMSGKNFDDFIKKIEKLDTDIGNNGNLTNYFKSIAEGAENARVNIVDAYAAILDGNTHGLKNVQSIMNTYNKSFEGNVKGQEDFAKAVGQTNQSLGNYLNNLEQGATASLQDYGVELVSAKIKTIALTVKTMALQTAMSLGLSLVINGLISGITWLVGKIDDLHISMDEAKESADNFKDSLSSFLKESQDNLKTVTSLSDKFEELSKNVDENGNRISGTAEEYDEYLSICEQVAQIMPDLISGYTVEGQAIIELKDGVDSLTESYENALRAKAALFLAEGDEDGNTVKSFFDDYKYFTEGTHLDLFASKPSFDFDKVSDFEDYYGYDLIHRWLEKVQNANLEELQNIGKLDPSLKAGTIGFVYINKLLSDNGYSITDITEENYNVVHDILNNRFAVVESEMTDRISNIKSAFQNSLYADSDYWEIDNSEAISAINAIYNSIDDNFIKQHELFNPEALQSFTSDVVALFNNADTQQAMIDFYAPITNDETINEYNSRVTSALETVQAYCEDNGLTVPIQLENLSINTMTDYVKGILKDEFDDKVGELSLGDLQIASDLDIPPNIQLTWEELLTRIEEVKSATQEITLTNLIAQSKELQNSFDDTFSKQSTIQSAFDKIQEGTSLTADEVRELKTLCPQLNNAFEQVADGWTISSEDLVNANENVTRSAKTSIQNQIELLKQIKKPTSVNSKSDWEQYDSWRQAQQEIAGLELILSMFGLTAKDTSKNFSDMADEVSSKTKLMSTAMEEMGDTGHISASTYSEIVEMGGNFAECLEIQNGQLVLNVQKLKELETQEYKNKISENQLTIAILQREAATRAMSNGDWQSISAMITELQKENEFNQLLIDEINNAKPDNKTDTTDSSDPIKAAFDEQMRDTEHAYAKGLISQEEYLNKLEEENEEHYKNSAEHYDDYLANIEKIYNGRKDIFKSTVDEQIKALDEQLEKGFISPAQYQSEMTKLMEQSYGMGSKYYGTEFATENYNEMSDMIEDKDVDVYESKLEELKKANDGSIEAEKQFIEQWKSLNKTMFEDTDPKKYKENLEEIAEYEEDWNIRRAENEKTYWENLKQEAIDYYDKEIEKLREIADEEERISKEKELQNNLIKAKQRLEDAKKNRNQLIFRNGTFEYVENQEEVRNATEEVNDAQKAIDENNREKEIEYWEKRKEQDEDFYDALLLKINNYIDSLDGNVLPTSSDSEVISNASATDEANKAQDAYDSLGKDDKPDTSTEVKTDTVVVEQTGQPTSDNTGIQGTKQLYTIDEAAKILADRLGVSIDSDAWKNFATSVVSNGNPQSSPLSGIQNQNVYNNSTVNNDNRQVINIGDINMTIEGDSSEQMLREFASKLGSTIQSITGRIT